MFLRNNSSQRHDENKLPNNVPTNDEFISPRKIRILLVLIHITLQFKARLLK